MKPNRIFNTVYFITHFCDRHLFLKLRMLRGVHLLLQIKKVVEKYRNDE